MPEPTYSLEQLATISGTPIQTLRHWIHRNLIGKPIGKARATRYLQSHLLRVQAIARLRQSRVSLHDIRGQIAGLSDEQLKAIAQSGARTGSADGVPAPPPEPTYPSKTWEIVNLMDGLFLTVDPNKGPVLRRIADEIYRHYSVR
jgi:DNA-binding transcriptional MerR regulator